MVEVGRRRSDIYIFFNLDKKRGHVMYDPYIIPLRLQSSWKQRQIILGAIHKIIEE